MKYLLLSSFVVALVGCSGPSSEDKKIAEKECVKFVERQMESVWETHVFDIYSKKGSVVVEVGFKGKYTPGDAFSVRLCVVDMEKGTISLPSPMNDDEWKK